MKPTRKRRTSANRGTKKPKFTPARLRIVSGSHRGRLIDYNGDPATRPMKQKTRESVFSLLGGKFSGGYSLDLFGGTGILGFEAVSRGAEGALILELGRPTYETIRKNAESIGLSEQIEVYNVDSLRWLSDLDRSLANLPKVPWIIFCCPPYKMWPEQSERLSKSMESLFARAPEGTQLICEAEHSFDLEAAMSEITWDVRHYAPTIIGVAEK